jgi:hypothetical protein
LQLPWWAKCEHAAAEPVITAELLKAHTSLRMWFSRHGMRRRIVISLVLMFILFHYRYGIAYWLWQNPNLCKPLEYSSSFAATVFGFVAVSVFRRRHSGNGRRASRSPTRAGTISFLS